MVVENLHVILKLVLSAPTISIYAGHSGHEQPEAFYSPG